MKVISAFASGGRACGTAGALRLTRLKTISLFASGGRACGTAGALRLTLR